MTTSPPKPSDFRAMFVGLGWGAIKEHYGVHSATISRWIDEEGRSGLIAARAIYVARLRERDRAFRRRAAALGLSDPAERRHRQLGTGGPQRTQDEALRE